MRFALVTDGIWPYVLGGMQKHSYYLCKYLARNRVYVDLYHFNQSNYNIHLLEFFTTEEKQFITSRIVEFPVSPPFPGHYLYRSYKHSEKIYEVLLPHLHEYDFIYTKGFSGWKLLNEKHAGRIKCAPIGIKFHGYEMFQKPPDFKTWLQHVLLLRNPVRSLSKKADVVFSYGGKITELIRRIGVDEKKIVELPSGVEAETGAKAIMPTGDQVKFLFLGRYERRKGIEEYNAAISMIDNVTAEFHFIGPIPEEKKLKRRDVFYHGEIRDRKTLTDLIRLHDVLVCPSWSEGMPNVILEAMSLGLAVIATDVGAVNVVVNDDTGWLIQNSSPAKLAQLIKGISFKKQSEIDEKKHAAMKMIGEGFTWEGLIKRLLEKLKINPSTPSSLRARN
jgi:glycosyltransferase involved in cell wall biosynthesis